MALKDALLAEYDHEMKITRRLLERVPEDALDWKPHPRSMSMGRLAGHLAELPLFARSVLDSDAFDPAQNPGPPRAEQTQVAALLQAFDANVAGTRQRIDAMSDAAMAAPWSFMKQGRVVLQRPRLEMLRSFLMNHLIHHRGQMSVYLRLREVPVPAIYGPSADEKG